ncbi:MAG TPA: plastocyanin/azurin family copper-binding protein [Gemmatimonadales bacterium]|nr:plastocyanin/azurin family copper-binding protein [Gemmatimonadales bacterium]
MRIATLLVLPLAAAALGCGSDGGPTGNGNTPEGDILVRNNFFSPANFEATVGEQVVWAWNSGGILHNVTFDDGAPASPDQGSGTFARTFTAAGDYGYHCTIHGATVMNGTVSVGAAGGTGNEGGGGGSDGGTGGGGGGGGYDY